MYNEALELIRQALPYGDNELASMIVTGIELN